MEKVTRTTEEILTRIDQVKDDDFLGTTSADLMAFLPFEHVKDHLNEKYLKKVEDGEETWDPKEATKEQATKEITEYMDFAWGKANDCRGLSADRSINHMKAWLWIAGNDELLEKMDTYEYYGKPQLRAICEEYGIDWKSYDDGEWRNDEKGSFLSPDDVPKI